MTQYGFPEEGQQIGNSFFSQIVDNLEEYGIFTTDKEGSISSWNANAANIFGRLEEEIIGQDAAILFNLEDRRENVLEKELQLAIHVAIKEGRARDERWQERRDKQRFWVSILIIALKDEAGNVQCLVWITRNLTEEKRQAEQLAIQIKQQVRTFDATLTALKDFVYTFDTAGRFTYANSPLLELLGITLEEIIGKTFHELPYPEDLATLLQTQIELVVATEKAVTDETAYTSPTGVKGHYEYIFVPVFDAMKKITHIAGSTRDITIRKQLESQKDDFMSIVSHELKTPVTSIKAFTQVLQNRFARAGDEKSTVLLGKMDAQINKLTSLIEDLLDVTRIEGGELQFNEDFFVFDELVKEVIEEVQRTTNKHIIESQGATKKTIYGDKDRVEQVISNFLTNAIKYSPYTDKIIVESSSEKDYVTFCVRDFGIGIAKERQQQVFERFYRVSGNETIPGIGLGLYISAEIIKRQGGTTWVESEEGKGSTFCFRLPIKK